MVRDSRHKGDAGAHPGGRRGVRTLVTVGGTLAVLLVLLAGAYIALPAIINAIAPRVAHTIGLDALYVDVETATYERLVVRSFRATTGRVSAAGEGVRLDYSLNELLDGQLESVRLDTLELTIAREDPAFAPTEEPAAANGSLADWPGWFAAVPARTIQVERLALSLPVLDFAGRGGLRLSPEHAEMALTGIAPAEAARFQLYATATPDGQLSLRFENRDDVVRPLVALGSTLRDGAMAVSAELDLDGYAFQLLSELAGMPPGTGALVGALQTSIPWPPPQDVLDALAVNGSMRVDWQAADGTRVEGVEGDFVRDAEHATARLRGGKVSLLDGSAVAQVPDDMEITMQGSTVRGAAGLRVTYRDPPTVVNVTLDSAELDLSAPIGVRASGPFRLSSEALETAGSIVLDAAWDQVSRVSGEVTASIGAVRLPVRFEYDTDTETGWVAGNGRHDIRAPLLGQLLKGWDSGFDMTSGTVEWATALDISAAPTRGRTTVKLVDVNGVAGSNLFDRANGSLVLHHDDSGVHLSPSPITARAANVGVPISDIAATLAWRDPVLDVSETSFWLLGGRTTLAPFTYDLDAGDAAFVATLEQLDLARVLALEGDSISGTGKLDGTVPILIRNDNVSVAEGRVSASAPGGTIALSPSLAAPTGQPGLDFAMRALTRFTYTSLDVGDDYAENGDLALAVKLLGSNPDVEKGRQIRYNLNVSENIPALLRSLKAQHALTDQVERRVRKPKTR